jgi:hypothetical protein
VGDSVLTAREPVRKLATIRTMLNSIADSSEVRGAPAYLYAEFLVGFCAAAEKTGFMRPFIGLVAEPAPEAQGHWRNEGPMGSCINHAHEYDCWQPVKLSLLLPIGLYSSSWLGLPYQRRASKFLG